MNGQVAVVLGASGLIGNLLVNRLTKDDAYAKIIIITRRPFNHRSTKVINKVVDFNNRAEISNAFETADVVFCAIGTTQKKAGGDKAVYRKVDFDIPVNVAKVAIEKGTQQYVLVSAMGASAKSRNFYLRLKGQVEEAISTIGFNSVYLLRPSILLGRRKESRLAESIGKVAMQTISKLMVGGMRKYRPISANQVAGAMVTAGKERKPGVHYLYYDHMVEV
jgi:uncharacterized protein YbjT (DUF2867 family)